MLKISNSPVPLLFIFMSIFLSTTPGFGTENNLKTPPPQLETSMDVLYNRVLVTLKDGGFHVGLLIGIQGDSLLAKVEGEEKRFARDNLSKLVIEKEKKRSRYVLNGMLLGAYIGNLLSFRAKGQPGSYFYNGYETFWLLFREITYCAEGGGLGFLISTIFEKGEETFKFQATEKKQHQEWERLQKFLLGIAPNKKNCIF